jgi:GAF domain-containing protein
MDDHVIRAAAAAAVLGSDERHGQLLQSVCDLARTLYRAQAASVFLADDQTGELVFAAVSGQGERTLVGSRLPAGTGIAGWVLTGGQALAVDDLSADARFSRASAESTGYVPSAMAAAPVLLDDRAVGVLSVLDPGLGRAIGQGDLTVLSLLAEQAALALDIVRHAREARSALDGVTGPAASASRLAKLAAAQSDPERWARALDALADALDGTR